MSPSEFASGHSPTQAHRDVEICGWRVRSELSLPAFPLWDGDDRPPDITIRMGPAPLELEGPVFDNGTMQLSGDGWVRVRFEGEGRFLVDPTGREVVAQAESGGTPSALPGLALGSVLGTVSYRLGRVPLHGSCVLLGGQAVAFAGPSGAGKSTLAAGFQARGVRVLADDLLPVELASDHVRVHLTGGGLRLRGQTVEGLEMRNRESLRPVRGGKWGVPIPRPPTGPMNLGAIYLLDRASGAEPAIQPLDGAEAVSGLSRALYRRRAARFLLGRAPLLGTLAMLVERTAVFRLCYPSDFDGLKWAVAAVLHHQGEGRLLSPSSS